MRSKDTPWAAYGAVSAGLRTLLPPFIDGPFVRAIRGSMIDRIAKQAGVTFTAEARKMLVEMDDPMSARGVVERGTRWIIARTVPGVGAVDASVHWLNTLGTGALLRRYLEKRPRDGATGTVIDGFEATRIRRALKVAIDVATPAHAKGLAHVLESVLRASGETLRHRRAAQNSPTKTTKAAAEQALALVDAGLNAVPDAWAEVIEPIFQREFDR
jgi:uncharacterized protein (DUF697 family)